MGVGRWWVGESGVTELSLQSSALTLPPSTSGVVSPCRGGPAPPLHGRQDGQQEGGGETDELVELRGAEWTCLFLFTGGRRGG